eukprot:1139044-Pelagomonas_calceolata.AAC.4
MSNECMLNECMTIGVTKLQDFVSAGVNIKKGGSIRVRRVCNTRAPGWGASVHQQKEDWVMHAIVPHASRKDREEAPQLQVVILESEAYRQKSVNRAQGEADAILRFVLYILLGQSSSIVIGKVPPCACGGERERKHCMLRRGNAVAGRGARVLPSQQKLGSIMLPHHNHLNSATRRT